MKKLITANSIKQLMGENNRVVYIDSDTIVTPYAKDLASELKVEIKVGNQPEVKCCEVQEKKLDSLEIMEAVNKEVKSYNSCITAEMIGMIVSEVLKNLNISTVQNSLVKECDCSGVRLVRGESVVCESFDTGNPNDKVGIKEILNNRECPNMATGFMTMEKSSFDWTLKYDEIDYVVEGTMDIMVNGKAYRGKKGDVFFIPKDTSVTFSTPDYCKFFFTTYPANWAELSGYEKK